MRKIEQQILCTVKRTIGLCFLVFFIYGCKSDHNNVAFYVNDEPVSVSEMEFWMSLSKAEVANYFYREYGMQYSDDFWNKEFDHKSPGGMLKDRALEKLVNCKVQQIFARDLGIIEKIGFDELMAEIDSFNEQRKMKLARGEAIYGPQQFTPLMYFNHVFDKMVYDVKQHLLNSCLLTDTLTANLATNGGHVAWKEKSGFMQMQYIDQKYEQLVAEMVRASELSTD